ncbi:MGMT family protein [Chitinimonas koreensis]
MPYGSTASYQAQATKLGRPEAARGVAAVKGANRIAIVGPASGCSARMMP